MSDCTFDPRVMEKKVSKQKKELQKFVSGPKLEEEITLFIEKFVVDVKLWIVTRNTSLLVLPRGTKKLIQSVFDALKDLSKKYKSSFVTESFISEYNQIASVITVFINEKDTILKVWDATFWLMNFSFSNFSPFLWEDTIISFFKDTEDISTSLMIKLTENVAKTNAKEATFWWHIFIQLILPQYIYFPMENPKISKRSKIKRTTPQNLQIFSNFMLLIFNFEPKIKIFRFDDLDSCYAVASILMQYIYLDSVEPHNVHTLATTIFPLKLDKPLDSEDNSAYALCHVNLGWSNEERESYAGILNDMRRKSSEYINVLVYVLLLDIANFSSENYASDAVQECGMAILRFNTFLDIFFSLENITKAEILIVTGSFLMIISERKNDQILRLFIEFTYKIKELTNEAVNIIKNYTNMKNIIIRFISQVTVSSIEPIFGVKISELLLPNSHTYDPISIETLITGECDIAPPFFGNIEAGHLSYEEFENFILKLISLSPLDPDLTYIEPLAIVINEISKIVSYPTKKHLPELCIKVLQTIPDDFLDSVSVKGLHFVTILLSLCLNMEESEKKKYIDHLVAKLPDSIEELYNLSLSTPFIGEHIFRIAFEKNSNEVLQRKLSLKAILTICTLNNQRIINIDNNLLNSIIARELDGSNAQQILSIVITELIETENESDTLINTLLEAIKRKQSAMPLLSALAFIKPSFFKSDKILNTLFEVSKKLIPFYFEAFSRALATLQDICVYSKQLTPYLKFLESIEGDDNVLALIKQSKQEVFDGFSGLECGKYNKNEVIAEKDANEFVLKQNHLLGSSKITIRAMKQEESKTESDEDEEASEDELQGLSDSERATAEKFENALNKITQFSFSKPEDFNVNVPIINESHKNEFSYPDPLQSNVNPFNSFTTCFSDFNPQNIFKGKVSFETFHVSVLNLEEEESDNFKAFVDHLGERNENSVTFTCYRMRVIYSIVHKKEDIDTMFAIVWNDKKRNVSFTNKFLYVTGDLFPILCVRATKLEGFFFETAAYNIETLAKLLPWSISYSSKYEGIRDLQESDFA